MEKAFTLSGYKKRARVRKKLSVRRLFRSTPDKKTGGQLVVYIIAFTIMVLFCMSYLFAFLWAVFAATKTHDQIVISPFGWHDVWHWENFIDVFSALNVRGVNMFGMIGNSLWLVFGGAFLSIMGQTLMAYALTKFKFYGKKVLITINFLVMIVPIVGALPSQYRMYAMLGFIDSPLLLIRYIGAFGGNLLIIMSFFRNLSDDYREAAVIDGAGEYRILFTIILPLARGPILALFVMSVVGIWNDYMTALLYLPNMPTLATGIYMFRTEMTYRAHMEILMAATVLSAIPPLILYVIFNKTMLTNLSIGGVKE